MRKTTDVAIVGGGVIGCSIAYQLAKRGIGCTVFEQGRFASGASGATGGIIGPLWYVDRAIGPYFKLGMRSLEMFPTLAAELQEAGVDPEFRQNGILKPALTPELLESLKDNLSWQGEMGLGVRWLDRDEMIEREPEIHPDVLGGVFSPQEGCVRGKSFVDSLVHAGSKLGAKFLEGTAVTGLEMEGRNVTGVRTALDVFNAGHTILASGPWTGIAKAWIPEGIPVRPVKGQRVLLRRTGFLPRCTVQNVIPQVDGNVLVGATREESAFDQAITVAGVRQVTESAMAVFPVLRDAELVSAQAGVRPGSPDGVPIMGPIPGWEGLSVASGHDHAGIMLSPATGELMADFIATSDATDLEPFSVSRFAPEGESQGYVAQPLFSNVTHDR
jgi:glycine oxidase